MSIVHAGNLLSVGVPGNNCFFPLVCVDVKLLLCCIFISIVLLRGYGFQGEFVAYAGRSCSFLVV